MSTPTATEILSKDENQYESLIEKAIAVIENPLHWNNKAQNQRAIQLAREMSIRALYEQAKRLNVPEMEKRIIPSLH